MIHAGSLHGSHDAFLVALSILIAGLAAYTSLDLAGRVDGAPARARALWLVAAAIALGGGIWSMHFVAMLAFSIGQSIRYDIGLTLASLLAAMAVTGIGIFIVDRWRGRWQSLATAGVFAGSGIATMHYLGMAAVQTDAVISYDPVLFAVSIGIAVVAATAALWLALNVKTIWHRIAAAGVMGAAIAGMHYTAMAAAIFTANMSAGLSPSPSIPPYDLAAIIAIASVVVLGFGLTATLIDRRFADQRQRETALRHSEQRFRTLVSNIPGIGYRCRIDADYTIEFVSDGIEALTGFPAGDFVGNRVRTLISTYHPDDVALVRQASDRSIASRRPFTVDYRVIHRDGSVHWVHETGRAVFDESGRAVYLDGVIFDVTEQRRIEGELRASEQKFKSLLNNIPGAFYRSIVDEPYTMEYVSDAIEGITGYPASDFVGSQVRNFSSIAHPEDGAMVQQTLAEGLRKHQPFSVEYRVQHKDGSYRWIHERGQGVYDEAGKLRYLDGAIFDITESHKIREELLASEQKFKTLLTNIPGVFYRCANDANYTMEFISAAITDVSGYPPSDFIGNKLRSYASLIHPDDVALVDEAVNAGLARHEPFTIEYRIVNRDGSIHWVHEKGQGIYDINSQLLHLDGAIFDVTERHRIEEELRTRGEDLHRAQRRMSDAIESIGDGFILWDADDRLVECNSKYREFFAASADLLVPGVSFEELVRASMERGQYSDMGSDPEAWLAERIRRLHEAKTRHVTFEMQLEDGRWLRISDQRTSDGGIVGIRTDITERKTAEIELREANESLHQAMDKLAQSEKLATIGQVAATVSHELRNPLGAIRNSMALVRQLTRDKQLGVERALDRVDRNIERCTAIISDLLDFTRRKELSRQPTAIDTWLQEVLAEQTLPTDVMLARDLRASGEVAIDREKFRQVVVNLIENAAQALKDPIWQPPEGHRRSITVRTETAGPHVRLSVIDSGPGIAPDVIARIFEPLFTTKSFGVGLGLPTVRQIVEQHGGTIDVESRINEGSSFTIWLPRQGESLPHAGETTGREAAA
jgi:PAS domain S-box-containing protein